MTVRLYKYRSLATAEDVARTEATVLHSHVYLASPNEFNDPFEFAFRADFEGDEATKRVFFEAQVRERYPGWSSDRQRDAVEIYLDAARRGDPSANERFFRGRIRSTLNSLAAILSLTTRPDDILMWAHYADAHRGICLGFAPGCFEEAKPVQYSDTLPVVPVFSATEEHMHQICMTKSGHWRYEEEWRVVTAEPGVREYPSEGLVEIILGLRTMAETRLLVEQWVNKLPHQVTIKEASLSETRYAVELP